MEIKDDDIIVGSSNQESKPLTDQSEQWMQQVDEEVPRGPPIKTSWNEMFDWIEGDIFSDFGRSEEFLVDGDSLLLYIASSLADESISSKKGQKVKIDQVAHQNLYFIYHFELFLSRLINREAKFILLFLTKNKRFYKSQSLLFIRDLIINHFKSSSSSSNNNNNNNESNFNIQIFEDDWYLGEKDSFKRIDEYYHSKNFSFLLCLPPIVSLETKKVYDSTAYINFMKESSNYFSHFVDISLSEFKGSSLYSLIYSFRRNCIYSPPPLDQQNEDNPKDNEEDDNEILNQLKEIIKSLTTIKPLNNRIISILSSTILMIKKKDKPILSNNGYLIKVLSIYLSLMQHLPIPQRAFDVLDHYPTQIINLFNSIVRYNNILTREIINQNSINNDNHIELDVLDIKQFIFVSLIMSSSESWNSKFGKPLLDEAQSYLDIINNITSSKIQLIDQTIPKELHTPSPQTILDSIEENTFTNNRVDFTKYFVDNQFIKDVVGDIREGFSYAESWDIPESIQKYQSEDEYFDVTHHHCLNLLKNLPDAFLTKLKEDRVFSEKSQKRYSEKGKQGASHRYYKFAETLYDTSKKAVITELNQEKVKKDKVNYQVYKQTNNKVQKLKKKDAVQEKNDAKLEKELKLISRGLRKAIDCEAVISILLSHIINSDKINYSLEKLVIYGEGLKRVKNDYQIDNKKELFQLIQKYLRDIDAQKLKEWSEKQEFKNFIIQIYQCSTLLYFANLSNYINKRFKLGKKEIEASTNPTDSTIYFQLCDSHDTLLRSTGQKADSRVRYFEPDQWQRDLLDVVDKHESALICAPTSSGKTFISFYILEKVLRESNDGIAVYVSPTKALVNQMYCEILGRFDKNYENIVGHDASGKYRMAGIFTRDYRINSENCQILVTVPQCLELLFLSISNSKWLNRVKYIIFDEVHQIANSMDGAIWEQLLLMNPAPFVALSATIGNMKSFHSWLQEILPSRTVRMVNHTQRFNDLKTYNYDIDKHEILEHHPLMAAKINGNIDELNLLSEEAVQLYNVIVKRFGSQDNVKQQLLQLDPLVYFGGQEKNVYNMSKVDINQYQLNLKSFLNDRIESPEVNQIINNDFPNHNIEILGWIDKFPKILETLKEKDLLPVIVFCLSRKNCEKLGHTVKKSIDDKHFDPSKYQKIETLKASIERLKNEIKISKPDEGDDSFIELENLRSQLSLLTSRKPEYGTIMYDDLHDPKNKLSNYRLMGPLMEGVGIHHSGLDRAFLDNVEFLFRKKKIQVVIATGSLAMGINAPARSIIIAGDSPYLNTLSFRQMAGRAGRRGYEDRGHTIMLGISTNKVNRLINSKLSQIVGNSILSPSLVLRILCRYNFSCFEEDPKKDDHIKSLTDATKRLVDKSFFLRKNPNQNRLLFTFSTDLLYRQGYLNDKGQAIGLSGIISHLSYLEPFNFVMVSLIRDNVFDNFTGCNKYDEVEILKILCYLFNQQKIPNTLDIHKSPSLITLPPLPDVAYNAMKNNNNLVIETFLSYLVALTNYSPSGYLPYSKKFDKIFEEQKKKSTLVIDQWVETTTKYIEKPTVRRNIQSLGGSSNLVSTSKKLMSSLPHNTYFDISVLPIATLDGKHTNSYLLDFYKHGQLQTIIEHNGINEGDLFQEVKDFVMTLKTISTSLQFKDPTSKVTIAFKSLSEKYAKQFLRKFNIQS